MQIRIPNHAYTPSMGEIGDEQSDESDEEYTQP